MIWKNCGKTEKSSFESSSPRSVTGVNRLGPSQLFMEAAGFFLDPMICLFRKITYTGSIFFGNVGSPNFPFNLSWG